MDSTAIKISCKNLWKIYGPNQKLWFGQTNSAIEQNNVLEKLVSQEDHVGAVCNVSFDILTIF